ncbi:MAG: fumarylacetoacetate hydrolase family protein [Cyclobacteriaceae bacterium]
MIFTKPESSVLTGNAPFEIPKAITNVAYEVELAFRVHKKGKLIAKESAMDYVDAVALAIDFTAKDLLNQIRETKGPWAVAKGFDGATPLSGFVPLSEIRDINSINFTLDINGERMQNGTH